MGGIVFVEVDETWFVGDWDALRSGLDVHI